MFRITGSFNLTRHGRRKIASQFGIRGFSTNSEVPSQADVVIIGGGAAGCNVLYQLSKRGIRAVLLESGKLTNGTTWHTSGLLWRLSRPTEVDIKLLESSRNVYMSLEEDTGIYPGIVKNGGIFIARTDERIEEYKRLHSLGQYFNIDTQLISSVEAAKLSPILNPASFKAALYSPSDSHIDPTMLCSSLVKGATKRGGQVIENCSVTGILTNPVSNIRKITGVQTTNGVIKTECVVNAAGVWSRNISKMTGVDIPLTAMKHSYVVTESAPDVKGTPHIRDHDGSFYLKIQGDTIHLGGYENNPEILKDVADDFRFGLYELDKSVFQAHLENARKLCPIFDKVGIKSDICGPESFTPDHKPILGEDPRVLGLFHNSGYNSGGMQLSGGCADQLAIWIATGRPEIHMFNYDIRRFTTFQRIDRAWVTETSHESFARNYDIVFTYDQNNAGRNRTIDMFHEVLVAKGAVMEQVRGFERPAYYVKDRTAPVRPYDFYEAYENVKNPDNRYEKELQGERTFGFSAHHNLIGEEALSIKNSVGIFNLSHFTKMYLIGPDAQEAADWLLTVDTGLGPDRVAYSCLLNSKGGIEGDCTVTQLSEGIRTLLGPTMKGTGYYIVANGESGHQVLCHIKRELVKKNFKSVVTNATDKIGILSLQGPKSRQLLQSITEYPITDDKFPIGISNLIKINGHVCRAMRMSFVGELGYQLHIPTSTCIPIYNKLVDAGKGFDLQHIGFRAFYSLLCEKGYHLWNYDIRIDDNPVEADLRGICRENGQYLGKSHVDHLKQHGCYKRRAFFTVPNNVCLHGMETIWRDNEIVGYLRRGNYGYNLDRSIGIGYVQHPKGKIVDHEFLKGGKYEIDVADKKYPATLFLKSPFDPTSNRTLGEYESEIQ